MALKMIIEDFLKIAQRDGYNTPPTETNIDAPYGLGPPPSKTKYVNIPPINLVLTHSRNNEPGVKQKKEIVNPTATKNNTKVFEMQKKLISIKLALESSYVGALNSPGAQGRGQYIPGIPQEGFGYNATGKYFTTEQLDKITPEVANLLRLDQSKVRSILMNNSLYKQDLAKVLNIEPDVIDAVRYEANKISSSKTPDEEEQLFGSRPFGNFLINQFLNPYKNKSLQFLSVDLEKPDRTLEGVGATKPVNFAGLVQTIGRIGTPNEKEVFDKKTNKKIKQIVGENIPDGIWDVRTNNSLKAVAGIVEAYLKFWEQMGLPRAAYNLNNYQHFASLIPFDPEDLDTTQDKEKRAKQIIPHLKAIIVFIREFNEEVMDNPNIKPFIAQTKAFAQIKSTKEKQTEPNKLNFPDKKYKDKYEAYKSTFKMPITLKYPDGQTRNYEVTYDDLSSYAKFREFAGRFFGVHYLDPKIDQKTLNWLYEQVNNSVMGKG